MKFNKLMFILLIILGLFEVKKDFSAAFDLDNDEIVVEGYNDENYDVENETCISDTRKLKRYIYFGGDGNTKD